MYVFITVLFILFIDMFMMKTVGVFDSIEG